MENNDSKFEIISEEVVYKRYLSVTDRLIKYPDGRKIRWDVVGHGQPFVCVMIYYSKSKTVGLIQEYCQGINTLQLTFPCGGFDPLKHSSFEEAAKYELSEEAQLKGGKWIKLLPKSQPEGIPEVKWCSNRFIPFLVIDPLPDSNPRKMDSEETISILPPKSLLEIDNCVLEGNIMLPSVQTYLLGKNFINSNSI